VIETNLIDRNRVLSSKILLSASEESLREEEPGDPEDIRSSVIVPILQEADTFIGILNP